MKNSSVWMVIIPPVIGLGEMGEIMEFLTPGQRIKSFRKTLGMKQHQLQGEKVKRNFISMIENGERGLSRETARLIVEKLNEKALAMGSKMQISVDYLLMTPEEEATKYCKDILDNNPYIKDIDEVISISEKYNLGDIKARAYMLKADLIYKDKDYKRAFVAYIETLDAFTNINSDEQNAYLFNRLGLCSLYQLDFTESLEYFDKAYNYSVINDDKVTLKNSVYNIALSYRKLSMLDDAIEYINKYLSLCTEYEELENYAYAKIILANCFRDKKELGEAIDIYNELLKDETKLSAHLRGFIYNNLAILYCDIEKFKESFIYFDMSEEIRKEEMEYLGHTLIDKSNLYLKQKLYHDAEVLINQGITIAEQNNDLEYILKGYYLLEDIYTQTKDNSKIEGLYLKIIDILKKDVKNNFKKIYIFYTKLSLLNLNNNNIEGSKEYLNSSLNLMEISDKYNKVWYDDFNM